MKRLTTILALLAIPIALNILPAHASGPIEIGASNWKFEPGTITLHVGQSQDLRFTSTAGVHGVQSDDLGIPMTTIMPGKTVTVTVTPKKAGTYVLHCAIPCGPGHADMALKVKVEP